MFRMVGFAGVVLGFWVMFSGPVNVAASADHIIVSEVEPNPPGPDAGHEWVELYNPTSSSVDVSGWSVFTSEGEIAAVIIPEGVVIPSGGSYVVTRSSQWLDNEAETVTLHDSDGLAVDSTPVLPDPADNNQSWQRDADGKWLFESSSRGTVNWPSPPGTGERPESPSGGSPYFMVAVLVGLVVAALVMLAVYFGKRRRRPAGQAYVYDVKRKHHPKGPSKETPDKPPG